MTEKKVKKPFYKRGWFIGLVAIIIIGGIFGGGDSDNKESKDPNKPSYEYKVVEDEKTNLGSFERTSLRILTEEKLNKEQIETLLEKIEKDTKYNKKKDQLYIFLYDNELISDSSYSLGRLVHKDNETEIDSSEKDWNEQPTEEEYKTYKYFMDKSMELAEKDIFEDDEYVANEVFEEKDIEVDTILESVQKVNFWVMSGY